MDVFVLSSVSEGLPAAAERSVVATGVGSVGELVHEGETGFLVDAANTERIAERIEWLLGRPDESRTMGRRGAAVIRSRFTPARMSAALGRAYHEAVEGAS